MTTRDDYVEKLKQNLDKWNADLTRLEAKAKVAKTDMQIEYEMQLEALRKHGDEAKAKLKELQSSGEGAWKQIAEGADAAWASMREAFEKASAHFNK